MNFNIPDEISILHVKYKVSQVPVIDKGEDTGFILGKVNFTNNTILLDQGLCDTLKMQTLIHEIMHAVFFQTGQQEAQNNEAVCQAAAAGLMSVLQENDLEEEDAPENDELARIESALTRAHVGKKPTNYEKFLKDITPEKLADCLSKCCLCCIYQGRDCFGRTCSEGIEEWLKQEAEDERKHVQ